MNVSKPHIYLLQQFLNAVEIVVWYRVCLKIHHNFLKTYIFTHIEKFVPFKQNKH